MIDNVKKIRRLIYIDNKLANRYFLDNETEIIENYLLGKLNNRDSEILENVYINLNKMYNLESKILNFDSGILIVDCKTKNDIKYLDFLGMCHYRNKIFINDINKPNC